MKIPLVKLNVVKEKELEYTYKTMSDSKQAVECIRPLLESSDREIVIACGVNAKNKPVYIEVVAIGTTNACLLAAPELYKAALLSNATGLFLFHNHPSGEPEPSEDDLNVTSDIKKSGRLLGINLLDHIIIGDQERYYSFREAGKL